MGRLNVAPFQMEHVEEVLIVEKLSFSIPWSRESFINEISNNSLSRYVVCILDGMVIGYGGMWLVAGEAHITNIGVHPDFRKIGAASAIMEALLHICKRESVSDITLEVRESNVPAMGLYNKYGFAREGIRYGYYEDNKENAIIMWKHGI
jgi:ribosomal-protein-alanine N-acetyltransferase